MSKALNSRDHVSGKIEFVQIIDYIQNFEVRIDIVRKKLKRRKKKKGINFFWSTDRKMHIEKWCMYIIQIADKIMQYVETFEINDLIRYFWSYLSLFYDIFCFIESSSCRKYYCRSSLVLLNHLLSLIMSSRRTMYVCRKCSLWRPKIEFDHIDFHGLYENRSH